MRFIFVLFSLMLATPAFSATPPEDAADIARIEDYLNDITTLRARFLQVAPDGGMAEGSLALKRPGRMRFEYDPPAQIEVVADGLFVHYHDKELKQVTAVPISTTPLSVLLDDKVVLNGSNDGIVVTALERRPGLLAATIADKDDLGNGSVTLIFSDQPLQLRQWVVHDAQGLSTKLTLFDARRGVSLENGDFYFANPYTAGGGGGN